MHRRASASSAIRRPAAIVDLREREPAGPRRGCHPGVADGSRAYDAMKSPKKD